MILSRGFSECVAAQKLLGDVNMAVAIDLYYAVIYSNIKVRAQRSEFQQNNVEHEKFEWLVFPQTTLLPMQHLLQTVLKTFILNSGLSIDSIPRRRIFYSCLKSKIFLWNFSLDY